MVTSMWIHVTARRLAVELHPGKATRLFRASQGWFAGFKISSGAVPGIQQSSRLDLTPSPRHPTGTTCPSAACRASLTH